MSVTAGFALSLAVTIALLAGVVVTGLRARRRLHLPLVAAALVSLGVTIYFAEQLGTLYDLDAAGPIKSIHLTLAKIATAAYLLPIATGIRTIFVPKTRTLHRWVAFAVLGLTVAALITGTWMLLRSPPITAAIEAAGGLPAFG